MRLLLHRHTLNISGLVWLLCRGAGLHSLYQIVAVMALCHVDNAYFASLSVETGVLALALWQVRGVTMLRVRFPFGR